MSPLGERTKNWESIVARCDGVWAPVTSVLCGACDGVYERLRSTALAGRETKSLRRRLSTAVSVTRPWSPAPQNWLLASVFTALAPTRASIESASKHPYAGLGTLWRRVVGAAPSRRQKQHKGRAKSDKERAISPPIPQPVRCAVAASVTYLCLQAHSTSKAAASGCCEAKLCQTAK